jgi:GTPase SAR1 family protein
MLIVGQAGVGKTSLLKSLKGEDIDEDEVTTRGIENNHQH